MMVDQYERYILYICDETGDATFDCWYPDEANAEYDIEERGLNITATQALDETDGSKSLIIYAVPTIIAAE